MEFTLSEDELFVRQSAREVAGDVFTEAAARRAIEDDGVRARAWKSLAELGWAGIILPETAGGSGGTLLEACLIAEALHERFPFVPFVGSAIASAAHLRFGAGDAEDVQRLAAGAPFSVVLGAGLDWPGSPATAALDWMPEASGVWCDGSGVATGALRVTTVDRLDLLHPVAVVEAAAGAMTAPTEGLERAAAYSRLGAAAALTGLAAAACEEAVDYAKVRRQYGRAIGEFQAIQHLCAEMLVDVEASRSITYGGAWVAENAEIEEASRVARAAKAWCAKAAVRVCEKSIQVLGGIGVTWEHPAHFRLRSAHTLARAFGTPGALAASLARDAGRVVQGVV